MNFKRIVSLFLTAVMISGFSVARAEGDERIVSLQFAQDGTVTDTHEHELETYGSLTPRVITSMTGDRVVLDSTGAIQIEGQDLLNADEMTFETWISINSNETSSARRLLAIKKTSASSSVAEVLHSFDSLGNTSVLKNRLGTKSNSDDEERWIENSTGNIYENADTWKHYVFTRKWNSETLEWTTKTYIDGVLEDSSTEEGVKLNESGCKFFLGSNTTSVTGLSKGLKCSYGTFNVYGKELDEARIAELYNQTRNDFRVQSNDLKVEAVTPEEGEISCEAGLITLKFSNFIDDSTLLENIVFSKEDGSAVEGWSASLRDEIFVDITIPKLVHKEKYKVTVKDGLMSQNEINATETEIIFTAKNLNIILEEDFLGDNFVVGAPAPKMTGIQFVSQHKNDSSANIKVGQTESGTKYLRLSPVELGKSEAINLLFSNLTEGCPVIEFKVRRGGDETVEPRIGMLNGANGTYVGVVGKEYADAAKDAEGFYYYKVIINKSKAGYYQYELCYANDLGEEVKKTINLDSKAITSISKYNIAQFYQASGTLSSDNYIDISYICHYILNEPKAEESSLETMNIENDEIVTVKFNENIKENTITEETVKLINKETGLNTPWTFVSYNAKTKTASFKVNKEYLEYDTEYEIELSGIESEDGIKSVAGKSVFKTPALDVTLSDTSFSKSESGINFSATVYSKKAAEVKFIAVLYDTNKRTVQVKPENVTFSSPDTEIGKQVNILMDYPSAEAGYTLKIITVENDNNNLKPIRKMPLEYQVK